MNWLCHALLVRPDPLVQAGAVLADDLKGAARGGLPPSVLHGMRHHEAVDRFTDAHPAIVRSKARVPAPYRRYAGVLVDVFYGRLLAVHWPVERHGPLGDWLGRLHEGLAIVAPSLEPWPQGFLERLIRDGWIADYAREDGHARVLGRLARRLEGRFGRAVPLQQAASLLEREWEGFAEDYRAFQPALEAALEEAA